MKAEVQVKDFTSELGGADSQNTIGYNDIVVALPSDEAHVPLIQASWSWRQVRWAASFAASYKTLELKTYRFLLRHGQKFDPLESDLPT